MSRAPLIITGIVVAVVLAGLWLLGGAANQAALDRSALGVVGLSQLAPDLGLEVELPRRVSARKASELSLRVLPLYDMDLSSRSENPRTRAERLGQKTLRELNPWVYADKVWDIETIVILPKWRAAVVVTGGALRTFLIPSSDFVTLHSQIGLEGARIQRAADGFVQENIKVGSTAFEIALFQPQTFVRDNIPAHCTERVGIATGALIVTCASTDEWPDMIYMSDPDVLNNHGLNNAGNAEFTAALLKSLKGPRDSRPIYLDTSTEMLLAPEADEEAQYYERDRETLLRFFAWPLSLLWLAGGIVLAVAIWRGTVRFGPVRRIAEDRLEVSKLAAIDAKARLIRMSRNDGQMVSEFVHSRLQSTADQMFGIGSGDAGIERLYSRFARGNPDLSAALRAHVGMMLSQADRMSGPDLRHNLERFKELLERLTHGPS